MTEQVISINTFITKVMLIHEKKIKSIDNNH